ncbi:hypothetical protein ACLKA6_012571 [Drosophila palustris]
MDRRCIICGEVPTSSYTYPNSMDEALKWQQLLTAHIPAETLRNHSCVCNKHIDNSLVQESASTRSGFGLRSSRQNDLNEQRLSVSFKESDAVHYFGKGQCQTKDSQSDTTKRELRRKDGCTQLPQFQRSQPTSNPVCVPSMAFDSDFGNSAMSFLASEGIERSTSGLDSPFGSCPFGYSSGLTSSMSMAKDRSRDQSYTTGATCICGSSCPMRNARMQQWHCGCTAAAPVNRGQFNGIPLRSDNPRQAQEHQGCQACLTADTCDQMMQCPSQERNGISQIPRGSAVPPCCYCDLNSNTTLCSNFYDNKSAQSNRTNSINVNSGNSDRRQANICPNNQQEPAPINVLVMSGSKVPSYYNSSDNPQSIPSEIRVLESDLTHEGAQFLDVDVPKFTVCRPPQQSDENGAKDVKEKESSTEVLLMGKAPSMECTCPASKIKPPFNSENSSKDPNCNELLKNQETRMLELESLVTQQQKLQQSIQAKLTELQGTAGAGKKPGATRAIAGTSAKTTPTVAKTRTKWVGAQLGSYLL